MKCTKEELLVLVSGYGYLIESNGLWRSIVLTQLGDRTSPNFNGSQSK